LLSGLHKVKKPRQKLGLFDGKKYTFETSDWWILTLLKMLWRFGLDMVKLNWLENSFMDKFLGYASYCRGAALMVTNILLESWCLQQCCRKQ